MLHNGSLINYCYDIVYIYSCQAKTVNLKNISPKCVPKTCHVYGQQSCIDYHQVEFAYAHCPEQIQQATSITQIDVHGIDAKAGA